MLDYTDSISSWGGTCIRWPRWSPYLLDLTSWDGARGRVKGAGFLWFRSLIQCFSVIVTTDIVPKRSHIATSLAQRNRFRNWLYYCEISYCDILPFPNTVTISVKHYDGWDWTPDPPSRGNHLANRRSIWTRAMPSASERHSERLSLLWWWSYCLWFPMNAT